MFPFQEETKPPRDPVKRTTSYVKFRTKFAEKFKDYSSTVINPCSSDCLEHVTNNNNSVDKNNTAVRHGVDMLIKQFDVEEDKPNIEKDDNIKTIIVDDAKKYGSILKQPGKKRTSIKHVEFLENKKTVEFIDNIESGDDKESVRNF